MESDEEVEYLVLYDETEEVIEEEKEKCELTLYDETEWVVDDEEERRELKQKWDEEKLVRKVSKYLKNSCSGFGLYTMKKLSELPVSTSAKILETFADIICREIFTTPVKQTDVGCYVQFYKEFAYLKATKDCKPKQTISFEEILTTRFLNKLSDRICFEQRLWELVSKRQIPKENKVKWIVRCSQQQKLYLKQTDVKSVNFLCELYKWNPEVVYKAMELLFNVDSYNAMPYMETLLKAINNPKSNQAKRDWSLEMFEGDFSWRYGNYWDWETRVTKEALTKLFQRITKLANEKVLNWKWAGIKVTLKEFLKKGPCRPMKYNYPKDYIKQSIQKEIDSDEWGRMKDDFEEDSSEEEDISTSLDSD